MTYECRCSLCLDGDKVSSYILRIQSPICLLLSGSHWFSFYSSLGNLSHKRLFNSHSLSGLMAMWGLFLYCTCFPVCSGNCGLMAVNPLPGSSWIKSGADDVVELLYPQVAKSSTHTWLWFPVSRQPSRPRQPNRESHQPFIHFSWKQPLSVINDSVRTEWCFWSDP